MKNIFKVISLASILLFAGNAVAMESGKSAGTKRDRTEQTKVDWRDTTLRSVFNNVYFPNTEKLRKKLAANKEDLNQLLTEEQKTVLYYAIIMGNIQNIELLLQHGANPNVDLGNGVTVLHVACKQGNFEIVKLLLNNGANPDAPTRSGKVARDFAQASKNPNFIEAYDALFNKDVPAWHASFSSSIDLMLEASDTRNALTESDDREDRIRIAQNKRRMIEDVIGAYALLGLKKI